MSSSIAQSQALLVYLFFLPPEFRRASLIATTSVPASSGRSNHADLAINLACILLLLLTRNTLFNRFLPSLLYKSHFKPASFFRRTRTTSDCATRTFRISATLHTHTTSRHTDTSVTFLQLARAPLVCQQTLSTYKLSRDAAVSDRAADRINDSNHVDCTKRTPMLMRSCVLGRWALPTDNTCHHQQHPTRTANHDTATHQQGKTVENSIHHVQPRRNR